MMRARRRLFQWYGGDAQEITRRITGLSDALPPEQRRWTSARLAIDSEGEYELKYGYAR